MNATLDNLTHAPLDLTTGRVSKAKLWTGRVLTGLPALFILVDGVMKQLHLPAVVEASAKIGFQPSTLPILGVIEILAVLCLCFRRTAALGAVVIHGVPRRRGRHARSARRSAPHAHPHAGVLRDSDLGWPRAPQRPHPGALAGGGLR